MEFQTLLPIFFIFTGHLQDTAGQGVYTGACPTPTPFPSLDRQSYSGVWNLIQKYESGVGHAFSCALANYFPPAADGTWQGEQNFTERLSGQTISVPATVSLLSKDGSGYLNADSFLLAPTLAQSQLWDVALTLRMPYWVLATDYCSFTVEWTCVRVGVANIQFLWIFSRTGSLSPDTLAFIYKALAEQGIDTKRLANYDTSGCVAGEQADKVACRY